MKRKIIRIQITYRVAVVKTIYLNVSLVNACLFVKLKLKEKIMS